MKTTVKNTSKANQGIWTTDGLVHLAPGESRSVTIADDYVERFQTLPYFSTGEVVGDEADLASLDLNGLAAVMVTEGMIPSVEEIADDLRRAIIRKREDDAEAGDHDDDAPATADDIVAAIDLLDARNEDHWTKAGLPEVAAVRELAGKPVTRAAIEAAAPDAKRPEPA